MIPPSANGEPRLGDLDRHTLADALCGHGLWLDVGAATVHVRSDSAAFAPQVGCVYGDHPFIDRGEWADLHVQITSPPGLRRWFRPQVVLRSDGITPFDPFPADSPLPLFEWGGNWLIGRRLNDLLLLHAGVVERDGMALILPATPGSGKSTLTAALSQRGWRLLSDEFGAYDPEGGVFRAVLKPVALKNQSIAVIRAFAPAAVIGPEFPKTRKGTVAHLAPTADAVARRHETARPGAVILPRWQVGSATKLEPVAEHVLFPALAFNAFNYTVLGAVGFQAAIALTRRCPAWQLVYSDLDDALARIDNLWAGVRERHETRA